MSDMGLSQAFRGTIIWPDLPTPETLGRWQWLCGSFQGRWRLTSVGVMAKGVSTSQRSLVTYTKSLWSMFHASGRFSWLHFPLLSETASCFLGSVLTCTSRFHLLAWLLALIVCHACFILPSDALSNLNVLIYWLQNFCTDGSITDSAETPSCTPPLKPISPSTQWLLSWIWYLSFWPCFMSIWNSNVSIDSYMALFCRFTESTARQYAFCSQLMFLRFSHINLCNFILIAVFSITI